MSDENETSTTHRFIPCSDILLLREIVALDIAIGLDWESIVDNLNTGLDEHGLEGKVNERQAKDRKARLVKAFRGENLKSLKASGTNEEYHERERLLQEIVDKEDEVQRVKADKKKNGEKNNKQQAAKGLKVRDAAMKTLRAEEMPKLAVENIDENDSDFEVQEIDEEQDLEPRRKKRKNEKQENQSQLLGILKERNEIQKRELALMGKKFAAETEERKGFLELMKVIVEQKKE